MRSWPKEIVRHVVDVVRWPWGKAYGIMYVFPILEDEKGKFWYSEIFPWSPYAGPFDSINAARLAIDEFSYYLGEK